MGRAALALGLVLVALAAAMYAYDRSRADVIADGVRIGGVEVGGLSPAGARAAVRARHDRSLRRPLVVRRGPRHFTLTVRDAGVRVDVAAAVEKALERSRQGNLVSRAVRDLTAGELDLALRPAVRYSGPAVERFVERVGRKLDRPARDARVEPSAAGLSVEPGKAGSALDRAVLRRRIDRALRRPGTPRRLSAPVERVRPAVTRTELRGRYPYFITVDRTRFRLHFFKRLRRATSYVIAVGQIGFETPEGLYHIQNKAVNPVWSVPDRPWAGELAGSQIPPGPDNPIKARWMGIYDGAGIHGTDDNASLGTAASRGCIRMAIPEVMELYDQVPVETPVYIG